jgi:hypothetical protein
MAKLSSLFDLCSEMRILDVGGTLYNWQFIESDPKVDLLNLKGQEPKEPLGKSRSFIVGNGLDLKIGDNAYDIVYSNSVIEHVGSYENQQIFAKELKRVANGLFVQTPAKEFFLEPHYLTPFIHWLPIRTQKKLLRNFSLWGLLTRPSNDTVDTVLGEIRLLNKAEFHDLFHDCTIITEKLCFFTKSYIAYRPVRGQANNV